MEQEHIENLRMVLQCLENAGLRLSQQKCEFFRSSVMYLGHQTDWNRLDPMADKVEAVRIPPKPINVKELRAWLGIVNYLSIHAEPFFETGNVVWVPKERCEVGVGKLKKKNTFIRVKEALQSDDLLVHFDPSKPILLACDASPYGCGCLI